MPVYWPFFGAVDNVAEPSQLPGVNRGTHRGFTKSPKPKPRKRR